MDKNLSQDLMIALKEELEYLISLEKNLQASLNSTDFGPDSEKVFVQRKLITDKLKALVQRIREIEGEMMSRRLPLPEEAKIILRNIVDKASEVRRAYKIVLENLEHSVENMIKDSRKLYHQNKTVKTYIKQI